MFYSQCLLSSKGRLGSIWVAAYCFKKLKKAQVAETDISASIDTLRAPYDYVTLPERFELDAFDFGILEDVSGGNVVSYEAITLKDCPKGNAGQFPSDMYDYEEFGACHGIFSANYIPDKDVLPFDGMELDMEIRTSSNEADPDVNMENPQDSRFLQEETNGDQIKVPDMSLPKDGTEGEARPEKLPDVRSEEKGLNHESFHGIERTFGVWKKKMACFEEYGRFFICEASEDCHCNHDSS